MQKGSIGRNIVLMTLGTVLAQSINVLVQPILTRIVPAETLGIYTYLISLASMVIPVASLKLDMLIVSERSDKEAQYITDVSIMIVIFVSVVYLLIILLSNCMSQENVFNKYGLLTLFVPAIVFTSGLRFLFISYNNRYKQYQLIARIGLLREGSRAIIQILGGVLRGGEVGQLLGYLLAPLFGIRYQIKHYVYKLKKRKFVSWDKCRDIIFYKGRRQICYLVPAQFVNSVTSSLITISIAFLFSSTMLAYYSASVRLLDIPSIFISSNISKVCFKQLSENVNRGEVVVPIILKIILLILPVSILGFGILYFVAQPFCGFVFGKEYTIAGDYIQCLTLMYILRLVSTSFVGIFTVFGKQKIELFFNISLFAWAILTFVVAKTFSLSLMSFLSMINIGYSLVYLAILVGYILVCMRYDRNLRSSDCK